jgi:hypothetical protein
VATDAPLGRFTGLADADGRFTSGSIWTKWRGWEFCRKKEPTRWVTLLAWRALARMGLE